MENKKFKAGDKVVICSLLETNKSNVGYPLRVMTSNEGSISYTEDGRYLIDDKNPTLKHFNDFLKEEQLYTKEEVDKLLKRIEELEFYKKSREFADTLPDTTPQHIKDARDRDWYMEQVQLLEEELLVIEMQHGSVEFIVKEIVMSEGMMKYLNHLTITPVLQDQKHTLSINKFKGIPVSKSSNPTNHGFEIVLHKTPLEELKEQAQKDWFERVLEDSEEINHVAMFRQPTLPGVIDGRSVFVGIDPLFKDTFNAPSIGVTVTKAKGGFIGNLNKPKVVPPAPYRPRRHRKRR